MHFRVNPINPIDPMPNAKPDCNLGKCKPEARPDDVEHGHRHKILPPVAHQLVVTEARQRTAHPDIQKEEKENLGHEPQDRYQDVQEHILWWRNQIAKWAGPATEKEQSRHT